MKHAKKLVSILLVLAMALTLSVAAFAAAGDPGTIKIENALTNTEYNAYKIFDLEFDNENDIYTYTIETGSPWYSTVSAFIAKTEGISLKTKDADTMIVEATDAFDEAAAAEFAKELKAANVTATADATLNATNGYTASVPYGYYFVDSNLGTLCELRNTNPTATISEKNEVPEIKKEVQEDSDSKWGAKNDADLGQVVDFKATIKVKTGAENYVMHDKMSDGLTFDSSTVKVFVDNTAITAGADTFTVKTSDLEHNDCDFEIVFSNAWIADKAGKDIVVEYSATVNENAVIAGEGNPNETWLDYGEEFSTEESVTTTFVWEFGVSKVIAGTTTPLAGAKFTLSKSENGTPLTFTQAGTVYTYSAAGSVTEFETTDSGKFSVKGLDADTYYLTETEAPAGYNKLNAPIKVVINNDGKVFFDDETTADADKIVEVENNTGTQLPETGGMGTTVLYVIGALLVVGAIVLLVSKKRMSMAEAAE